MSSDNFFSQPINCKIVDSFVRYTKLKSTKCSGEAWLYIGREADNQKYDEYFSDFRKTNKYFFEKNNLISYIDNAEFEYKRQKRGYRNNIIEKYNIVIDNLHNYLIKTNISKSDSYLIMLGILHNEMHNEALIFTKLSLYNTIDFSLKIYIEPLINDMEFCYYKKGTFKQGSKDSKDYLNFDNEMPQFKKYLNDFFISTHMITENMFLEFIINEGYTNDTYWCRNGKIWKTKNNISLPLYWYYENGFYYKLLNNTKFSVKTNLPIINISYYEAKAYCKWKGFRLPNESEYEYVSTNAGTTKFPWGNDPPCNDKCNINYNNFIKPVNYYK